MDELLNSRISQGPLFREEEKRAPPILRWESMTVQCTRDGQFVVVVSRNATSPQLSLDSVSLQGGRSAPCGPVSTTAGFAMFQFPVSACGTSMKVR
uniref:ZP domain-containing protein n=1 Tax=Lepisosteus oculatus TaxID=7918 RepID=W5NAQ8_LEPOC